MGIVLSFFVSLYYSLVPILAWIFVVESNMDNIIVVKCCPELSRIIMGFVN